MEGRIPLNRDNPGGRGRSMNRMYDRIALFCDQRKPVTLSVGRPPLIVPARFRFVSENSRFVAFEVLDGVPNLEVSPGDPCTVIFVDGLRTSVFASAALEYDAASKPLAILRIGLPEQIVRTETRSALRIPLHRESELRVTVHCRDRWWTATPVDISLGGVLVEFPPNEPFNAGEDDELLVDLELPGRVVQLEGMAQSRLGNCHAIYFSEVLRRLRHGDATPPDGLREILDELEDGWLRWGLSA